MLREAFLIFSAGAMENRSFTLVYLLFQRNLESLLREVNRVTIYYNRNRELPRKNETNLVRGLESMDC